MWPFKKKEADMFYEFEYRVTERKHSNGNTYYTGESTNMVGQITHLCDDMGRTALQYESLGYPAANRTAARKVYLLMTSRAMRDASLYSVSVNMCASMFDDPIKVKELICEIRRNEKEKAANRRHNKVVSEGLCKC